MAVQLPVQPSFDERLLVENPEQVVKLSAQQTVMRRYPATSANNNTIAFQNILQLGSGVLIDPVAYVVYQIAVVYPTAAGNVMCGVDAAGDLTATDAQVGANAPTIGFAQYPLHANSSSVSVSINNVSQAFTSAQLFAVAKEWILTQKQRETLASSCPSANSTSAISYNSVAALIPEQPLTPSIQCRGLSRASIKALSAVAAGGNTTATFEIKELVMIPPFSPNGGAGLGQVQSLGLTYNIDSSNNLRGFLNTQTTVANLSASITQASLELTFLTPDQALTPIPAVCAYNYDFPDLQQTAATVPAAAANNTSSQVNTQSQKLTTIPKLYGVRICQNYSGRSAVNSNGAGFPIIEMTIQFGNFGNYQFNRAELWRLWNKNAPEAGLNYNQWVQIGTPCLIDVCSDLTGNGIFPGMVGDASVMWSNQITFSTENFVNAGGYAACDIAPANVFAYEIFIQSGSVSIGGGSASFKNTSAPQSLVIQSLQEKDAPADTALTGQMAGRGLFSTLKNVFHHAKKHAGTVAKMLPVAQAGLEALAGSGASGGMLYRRRR